MQSNHRLNSRQQRVLWATVRHYVATAEPVGSKSLVEEYNLQASPATIRNAMGVLEKTGLLYQPHTSAGRVPSDSGYRTYVDQLMQPADAIAQDVSTLFDTQLDWEGSSLEVLLKGAAQILSSLSGYITLVTLPRTRTAALRHIQLVQVAPGQILLVVVLDSYGTQSVLIRLPGTVEERHHDLEQLDQELQLLSNFLNHQLRGQPLETVTQINWSDLDREFLRYAEALKQAMGDLARQSQSPAAAQIMVSGLAEVLRQPEFAESHQVQAIVRLLEEERQQLWPLMFETNDPDKPGKRVRILIGAENPLEPMHGCTLVSSTYQKGVVPIGSIGMVGPTRMVYENAVALVEAAADYFSETLSPEMS
ncbi:MAG: heat-inducible transcriptional repressor HrcA [Cyanobacteria bacterium P01_A01_bin.123]